jgi:hypothetical protein
MGNIAAHRGDPVTAAPLAPALLAATLPKATTTPTPTTI